MSSFSSYSLLRTCTESGQNDLAMQWIQHRSISMTCDTFSLRKHNAHDKCKSLISFKWRQTPMFLFMIERLDRTLSTMTVLENVRSNRRIHLYDFFVTKGQKITTILCDRFSVSLILCLLFLSTKTRFFSLLLIRQINFCRADQSIEWCLT